MIADGIMAFKESKANVILIDFARKFEFCQILFKRKFDFLTTSATHGYFS
jgi:hypothetical protein